MLFQADQRLGRRINRCQHLQAIVPADDIQLEAKIGMADLNGRTIFDRPHAIILPVDGLGQGLLNEIRTIQYHRTAEALREMNEVLLDLQLLLNIAIHAKTLTRVRGESSCHNHLSSRDRRMSLVTVLMARWALHLRLKACIQTELVTSTPHHRAPALNQVRELPLQLLQSRSLRKPRVSIMRIQLVLP